MIYAYIRVSTDKQSTANQKFEIQNFVKEAGLTVDKWIMEKISSKEELDRRQLGNLLKQLSTGDILISSEISRLGRNLMQIMSILHFCMENEVKVWTIKDKYRLGNDIQSKVLAFAFGLSAEIERTLISQRTKEALARIKSDGKQLGRPSGSRNGVYQLEPYKEQIEQLLSESVSLSSIAKKFSCNRKTLYRFIDNHGL